MTEPLLLQFLKNIVTPKRPYCVVCLRSEDERRLQQPWYLKKFIMSLNQPYMFIQPNQLVCYICERQAAVAFKFRVATNLAMQAQTVITQLQRSYALQDKFRNKFALHGLLNNPSTRSKKVNSLDVMMECEISLCEQRSKSQLLQTQVLQVTTPVFSSLTPSYETDHDQPTCYDPGTFSEEYPSRGESSDLYVIPDDVPRERRDSVEHIKIEEPEIEMDPMMVFDEEDPISITKTSDTQPLLINTTLPIHFKQESNIPLLINTTLAVKPITKPGGPLHMVRIAPQKPPTELETPRSNPNTNTKIPHVTSIAIAPKINQENTARTNPANTKPRLDKAITNPSQITARTKLKQDTAKPNTDQSNASSMPLQCVTHEAMAAEPTDFILHPIVFNSGMMTVPSLKAQIVDGGMLTAADSRSIVPQIALQNGDSFDFVSEPTKVTKVLKMLSHQDAPKVRIFTNATQNSVSAQTQTERLLTLTPKTDRVTGVTQTVVSLNKRVGGGKQCAVPLLNKTAIKHVPKSAVITNQNLNIGAVNKGPLLVEAHSLADKGTAKGATVLKAGEINWEDKIPMDVISFMNADENSSKRLRMSATPPLPALGIADVTSLSHGRDDVIDLC